MLVSPLMNHHISEEFFFTPSFLIRFNRHKLHFNKYQEKGNIGEKDIITKTIHFVY